jgi:HipA-like kinase
MRHLTGIRYATPLREGGSLPAIVEMDGGELFVVKFLGAGQGQRALIAEALAAALAVELGLPVAEPAIIQLDESFGRSEPDQEIQDILRKSHGENFGMAFISGALPFDPVINKDIDPDLAADIVWFDALITNVDRSPRNVNMLMSDGQLWMIDHGASLYFHHRWEGWEERVQSRFPQIKDHVLLHLAGDLSEADQRLRPKLSRDALIRVADEIPASWLGDEELFPDVDSHRRAYVDYIDARLNGPQEWLEEAIHAKSLGPQKHVTRVTRRVV